MMQFQLDHAMMQFKLGINFEKHNGCFKDWLEHMINTVDKENLIYLSALSYNIWFARNLHVFEDNDTPEVNTISKKK